jgi:tetratricopeptide (TPR) repeat protein
MKYDLRVAVSCAVLTLAGCAGKPSPQPMAHNLTTPTTQPLDPKANLSLDEIEPKLTLEVATTLPSRPAPLAAIQAYAQARALMIDNRRLVAIKLLEEAARLDAHSFDIEYDLARAYAAGSANGVADDAAMAAYEKAAAIEPDRLELQYEMGRQYLERNDQAKALTHLRLARMTSGYSNDRQSDAAAMVDFFLGRALRQGGYIAAALRQYESLIHRLERVSMSSRTSPELAYFAKHPQILYTEIGELYEKAGQPAEAMQAYQAALSSDKENGELAKRVVRMQAAAGHRAEAKARAATMVAKSHGSPDSLEFLKEIYQSAGDSKGLTQTLEKLAHDQPGDRLTFYALLDQLTLVGRGAEAEKRLVAAARDSKSDADYIRRLFSLYQGRGDLEGAMRLLVDSLADRPDSLRDIGPLWAELLKPTRHGRLRLYTLQHMTIPPREEPARLFWVSRLAEVWNRDALSRSALQQAAEIMPPFAPAYRTLIGEHWAKADWDEKQKAAACQLLIDAAASHGDAALGAELRGRMLLLQDHPAAAAEAFTEAESLGNQSPDLQLIRARATLLQGEEPRAEQLLWKLVSDWPQFEEAYSELFTLYLQRRSVDPALGVLRKWLAAVPTSVDARLLEAAIDSQTAQPEALAAARTVLQGLFEEQPENLAVLRAMEQFYRHHARLDDFISKLETERIRNPENREAAEVLVSIYAEQKRLPEAMKVLDAARAAVAKDPDLLYYVAHLYERVQQKEVTEQLLEEIVAMDPHHAAASNDLGYGWADEGKNLDRAESLVRVAVEEEPDNQSYLDSMAWVEYKRGKFAEARGFLDRAIGPANRPDPVVLDHLGDTLYRLKQPAEAARQWQRSLDRLGESNLERSDLKDLRQQLLNKLKQQGAGRPVDVAPVVETRLKSTAAK